ncbi:hypothetical protein BC828DRAFT_383916 [Blastocladiella britannica]|nr:hypothetical protein BC828DRAFT_383916 [Blastocladiella britannica]
MKFSILLFVALTAVIVNAAPPADVCNGKLRQRKAYSTLSLADKKAFADGIWAMKRSGKYDYFTKKHRSALRWHQTTHFLPMHRAMMTEFETELLKAAPTLSGLPFWDEFSDLTNPTQSPIFTATTLGPMASGPISGTFKGLTDDRNAIVERDPDQSVMARAFKWIPRNQVLAKAIATFPTYGEMSHAIESTPHGTFHLIVGGHMGDPSTSPSDPAFWVFFMFLLHQGNHLTHNTI